MMKACQSYKIHTNKFSLYDKVKLKNSQFLMDDLPDLAFIFDQMKPKPKSHNFAFSTLK